MPHHIKWRGKHDAIAAPPMQFSSMGQAIEFASALLSTKPDDIWVEDERGWRVADMQRIVRHPRTRGSGNKR